MKLFLTYWTLAGLLYMHWAHASYHKIQDWFPWINILPKWVVLLLQFLVGGLIVPFFIPIKLHTLYLQISNYTMEKQNDRVEQEKQLGQFVLDTIEEKMIELKREFSDEGAVPFVTFVIAKDRTILVFTADEGLENHMDAMTKLIMEKCIEHEGVAVIQRGEGYEYKDENKIESERKEILIMSVEFRESRMEYIFGADKAAKKVLDVKKNVNSVPVFATYLTKIFLDRPDGNQN